MEARASFSRRRPMRESKPPQSGTDTRGVGAVVVAAAATGGDVVSLCREEGGGAGGTKENGPIGEADDDELDETYCPSPHPTVPTPALGVEHVLEHSSLYMFSSSSEEEAVGRSLNCGWG